MKKIFPVIILLFTIALLPSCKKCYTCYNMCSVCNKQYFQGWPTDTTLTILVESDKLSREYYFGYIDSLENMPNTQWECHDTTYTKAEKECTSKRRLDGDLAERYDAGWNCTEY